MNNIRQVSIIFIKNSKLLTFSYIVSICISVILVTSMLNFSWNAKNSYKDNLKAEYGDCDILATYDGYEDIKKENIEKIKDVKGVENIATGRITNKLYINGNNVYAIGVHDNKLMKSRYKYDVSLEENQIIINSVLANVLQRGVGDKIIVSGKSLLIREIIKDSTKSSANIAMAIVSQKTLTHITKEKNVSNFILIKGDKNVAIQKLAERISIVDRSVKLQMIEADSLFRASVETFSSFIYVLSLSVIFIVGLFVVSIFRNFMYKYNHSMAIIRAIGGNIRQVSQLFIYITLYLNGIGCVMGLILSVILNGLLLKVLDKNVNIINGSIRYYPLASVAVTFSIFLLMTIIMVISMRRIITIAPIKAIVQNEKENARKRYGKRKTNLFILSRICGKDFMISIKMISSKIKDNSFIILTITMIVVLSFVGSSLSSIIERNNNNYIKNSYLTNLVVTNTSYINYKDTMYIYNQLTRTRNIKASIVLINGESIEMNGKDTIYQLADLETMEEQGILHNKIENENRIVIGNKLATKMGISVGDAVSVNTPTIYKVNQNGVRLGVIKEPVQKTLYVSAVISEEKMLLPEEIYIDIRNKDFLQENMGMKTIYITGDLEKAETILSSIKEKYPSTIWSNYKEMKQMGRKAIQERYGIFQIVISILVIIAGMGWFHSIRSIILSRKREYCILRMQGLSVKRLSKMIALQIFIYLIIGILFGIVLGTIILMVLMYREGQVFHIIINIKTTMGLMLYMIGLSLMLIPTVRKIGKEKLVVLSEN
jgi:putative ABC transport system permease protein